MDTKEQLIAGIQAELELQKRLKRSFYSSRFYEFSAEVIGWKDIYEPLHRSLCNFIIDNAGKKQVLIELPRGTFKSSIVTVGYSLYEIVKNPNVRILVVNATYEMVKKFISQIQDNLRKNKGLMGIYGDLGKDSEIWNENTIKLKTDKSYETKEPTVFGYGMQGNLVSSHFDVIILDDLVNWDNTFTAEQIEKVKSFYKSCLDLLEPHGKLIVIGTPYHYNDLYAWIEDPQNDIHRDFAIYKKPAYTGDFGEGELLFPERLSWERLEKLRRAEGPTHFASQYMLTPILSEDAIFKYDFRYYDESDLKGIELLTFMTVDPALSVSKDADQTAMVVVSVDNQGIWYIRDILVGRFGPLELIQQLFYMDDKWKPKTIGIETVAFQKALASFIQDETRRQHRQPMPLKLLKPEHSRATGLSEPKQYRIESLEPRYATGMIFHNKDLKANMQLEDQLRRFPKNSNDDIIDALAYQEQIAFPPRGREMRDDSELPGRKRFLY